MPGAAASRADVLSAGAVVTRPGRRGTEVLLVHRPRYDDWSVPKGKVDRGEHPLVTAVREVEEETGLRVRLGARLPDSTYETQGRSKRVLWWTGRVLGDPEAAEVRGYTRGTEIDEVRWVPAAEARGLIDFELDSLLVDEATQRPQDTHTLLVVRHAKSRSRKRWKGDDTERTLTATGTDDARALPPLLGSYAPTRVVSSSSTRCVDTVRPYAKVSGQKLHTTRWLAEEHATKGKVRRVVADLLARDASTVLCSHRPVLPLVYAALGIEAEALETGDFTAVTHVRGQVLAVETHSLRTAYLLDGSGSPVPGAAAARIDRPA
ncbi:NUDIX hydrolase [Nocardioidaceae bacterium]|nr:NUDIX hydrolase [Nocardioidaceae bacterium]